MWYHNDNQTQNGGISMFRKAKDYLKNVLKGDESMGEASSYEREEVFSAKETPIEEVIDQPKSALDHYDDYIHKVNNDPYDFEYKNYVPVDSDAPAATSINERGNSSDEVKRRRIAEKLLASKQKQVGTGPKKTTKRKPHVDTSLLEDKEAIEADVERALDEIAQANKVIEEQKEAKRKELQRAEEEKKEIERLEKEIKEKEEKMRMLENETILTVIQRYTQDGSRFCFDTNYFFHHRLFIEEILNQTNHEIYVSVIVQQELDYNKTSENRETSSSARGGLRLLEAFQLQNRLVRLDNLPRRNVRDIVGFDPRNNDDRIVAMYVMEQQENHTPLVFCTADVGARMTARDTELVVFDTDKYMLLWQHDKREQLLKKEYKESNKTVKPNMKEKIKEVTKKDIPKNIVLLEEQKILKLEIEQAKQELAEAGKRLAEKKESEFQAQQKELAELLAEEPERKLKYDWNFEETQAYQAFKRLEKEVKKMRAHAEEKK